MAERFFAQLFSWLFHPLLMCTYATVLYFTIFPTLRFFTFPGTIFRYALVVFIATAAMPALWTVIWKRIGRISSLEMNDPAERRLPLLIVTLMYAAVFYILKDGQRVPQPIPVFLLGAVMAQTMALLITLYWKISLHSVGIGGLTGLMMGCYFGLHEGSVFALMGLFILSGLVCTSRLILGAHRPEQVYTGWLLGFAAEFALIFSLS